MPQSNEITAFDTFFLRNEGIASLISLIPKADLIALSSDAVPLKPVIVVQSAPDNFLFKATKASKSDFPTILVSAVTKVILSEELTSFKASTVAFDIGVSTAKVAVTFPVVFLAIKFSSSAVEGPVASRGPVYLFTWASIAFIFAVVSKRGVHASVFCSVIVLSVFAIIAYYSGLRKGELYSRETRDFFYIDGRNFYINVNKIVLVSSSTGGV